MYGNLLWGGTCGVHLNTVEMLQKRVVRVITGSEFLAQSIGLFHDTNILKYDDLHRFLLLLYFLIIEIGFFTPIPPILREIQMHLF